MKYSDEFINRLAALLNEYSETNVERPLCKKLAHQRIDGRKLAFKDLDKETLKILCIDELCSDVIIAAIFNCDRAEVKAIRQLYGYTDNVIPTAHTEYITCKLAEYLEKEMGERAFA